MKCDGSKPICGHCHTYKLSCSYPEVQHERKRARDRELQRIYRERTKEYIEELIQQVADQNEQLNEALQRISELEAQMAALQQIAAQVYGTSPCITFGASSKTLTLFTSSIRQICGITPIPDTHA